MSKEGSQSGTTTPSGDEKKTPEKDKFRRSGSAGQGKVKPGRSLSVSTEGPDSPRASGDNSQKKEKEDKEPRSASSPRQHSGMANSSPNIKTSLSHNHTDKDPAKKDMTKRTTTKGSSKMTELKASFLDSFNRRKQQQPGGELRSATEGTLPLSGGRKHEGAESVEKPSEKEKDKSLLSLKSRGSESKQSRDGNTPSTESASAREGITGSGVAFGLPLGSNKRRAGMGDTQLQPSTQPVAGGASVMKRTSKSKGKISLHKGTLLLLCTFYLFVVIYLIVVYCFSPSLSYFRFNFFFCCYMLVVLFLQFPSYL
jgi:hypothetical protein